VTSYQGLLHFFL